MNSIHEECGVFGIYSAKDDDSAALAYYGLYALQHRGQESTGIAVNDDGVFRCIKGEGLVSEVFSGDKLRSLGTGDRKSTRLNSSHTEQSRMPSSA